MEDRGGRGGARGGGDAGGHGGRRRGKRRGRGRGRGQPTQTGGASSPVQQPPPPTIAPAIPATVESPTSSHHVKGRGQPTHLAGPSSPVQQPPQPTIAPAIPATVESPTSSHHVKGWGQPTHLAGPSSPVQQPPSPTIAPAIPATVESPTFSSLVKGWGQPTQLGGRSSSVQQSPPPTIAPAIPATVQSPTSSHHVKETGDKHIPMRRPDKGGITNASTSVSLHVNHFPVKFNSDSIIMHYDVDIKPEAPPKKDGPVKILKSTLYTIRNKLCLDNPSQFPASSIAYDGEKNIFSAVELPAGKFKVELSEGEDMKVCPFIVTINLVKQLEFQKLRDYIDRQLSFVPRDILQGMDVVMKENPARNMKSAGRSFYPLEFSTEDELGRGIVASTGFQFSLKPTAQGLSLCLDYSVVPFLKPIPVLDFLKEHIGGFILDDFERFRSRVEDALKNLKVEVTHRKTSQKFGVVGLTSEKTRDLSFDVQDPEGNVLPKNVRLVDYFREKYDKKIRNQDIPCLDVGKKGKNSYVPMEFCNLVGGQRHPKEKLARGAAERLKSKSLPDAQDRKSKICAMVQENNGPCGGGIIDRFSIVVDKEMTSVEGRVIGPPQLKLGGGPSTAGKVNKITVDKNRCQWNLVGKSVVKGIPVDRWALVDFSANLETGRFTAKFIERCKTLGIQMQKPLFCESSNMGALKNLPVLKNLLQDVYKKAGCRLQILVCVMARRDTGYATLKWFSETELGTVTQCCLSGPASKGNDHYLANLALKLNAKLGGSNVELIDRLPRLEVERHAMFIGADVNHPGSPNTTSSPSIAAVVATVNWPAANRYAARFRPQAHRMEKIQNFGAMCLQLVEIYARENHEVKPNKIVVFRDGVSEGQFDMVLNEELLDLKRAFKEKNYSPTITLIVARKRHLTRIFPKKKGNVLPGTVVDTKVVHLSEFDFYLCSHRGTMGTSKPTHYHVLYDDHGFTSDDIQKLTYNLCFTFARCTKPVSLVPPVYYADLAAYRGRLYYDAILATGARPSASAASSSSSGASLDHEKSYRLHDSLKNTMFFI